ncbi:Os01g0209150, partial [Oryza sativa Japonica Group]
WLWRGHGRGDLRVALRARLGQHGPSQTRQRSEHGAEWLWLADVAVMGSRPLRAQQADVLSPFFFIFFSVLRCK